MWLLLIVKEELMCISFGKATNGGNWLDTCS
jgi:hypothetical protein